MSMGKRRSSVWHLALKIHVIRTRRHVLLETLEGKQKFRAQQWLVAKFSQVDCRMRVPGTAIHSLIKRRRFGEQDIMPFNATQQIVKNSNTISTKQFNSLFQDK